MTAEWDEIARRAWEDESEGEEPGEAATQAFEVFKAFVTELESQATRPDTTAELRDAAIRFQDFIRSANSVRDELRDARADVRRAAKMGMTLLGYRAALAGDLPDMESRAKYLGHVLFFAFIAGYNAATP